MDSFPLKIKINSKLGPFLNPLSHINSVAVVCSALHRSTSLSAVASGIRGLVHHRSYQEAGQLQAPQRASLPNSIPTMTDLLTQSKKQHLILNSLL